jgi:hypothetical protein
VAKARESLDAIEAGRPTLRPADYSKLHALFERTLLTARLHAAVAGAYYGARVASRGPAFRTPFVERTMREGRAAIPVVANEIRTYAYPPPAGGQWNWAGDAETAMKYLDYPLR